MHDLKDKQELLVAAAETLLARGQKSGFLRQDFDPALKCDALCAMVDGPGLHAISEPSGFPAARLMSLVTQELERLRP
jgi:hypothetical protein